MEIVIGDMELKFRCDTEENIRIPEVDIGSIYGVRGGDVFSALL